MKETDDAVKLRLFEKAWLEYGQTGESQTRCDRCNELIYFEKLSASAWKHSCACGRYSGTLRGF